MPTNDATPLFRIWAADNTAYGPVELPMLVNWIKDGRVTAETWVYLENSNTWTAASAMSEIKMFFKSKPSKAAGIPAKESKIGIKPGTLRRIKILADLDEEQLNYFLEFMEVLHCKQFSEVVKQGDHGDAMFLVLEGEVRARIIVDGKESTLATLSTGEFFGEISILDHGPRSTDIVANTDSILLKISSESMEKLMREAPSLGLLFLYALSKTLVGRMRNLTKRYQDSIHLSRIGGH